MTKTFNLKSLGALLLAALCLISLLPFSQAAENVHDGSIHDTAVIWSLDDAGTLTISGRGSCLAFSSKDDQPWADHRSEIRSVVFDPSAYLANLDISCWFEGCENLKNVSLSDAVRVIGRNAFAECPILGEISVSSDRADFEIHEKAFYLSVDGHLEVLLQDASAAVFSAFALYDFAADHRSACIDTIASSSKSVLKAAPSTAGVTAAGGDYCISCGGNYSYTLGYTDWGDNGHLIRHWCSNCGQDQCGGTYSEDHTYSNGVCTKCGHNNGTGGGDDPDPPSVCYHPFTSTSWSGCNWYEYCTICGEIVDSGTTHNYSYGSWSYYNTTRHKRTGTCTRCGATTTGYGNHTTTTKYDPYNAAQHEKYSYCSVCNSRIGTATKENHTFTYGSWERHNETQHRRTRTCSKCGYQDYEYTEHAFTYGSWESVDGTQHRRLGTCSCGYQAYEYGEHRLQTGNWENYGDEHQHRRKVSCACGYETYEYEDHVLTYGAWQNAVSGHKRAVYCSCGYRYTETQDHNYEYGSWENYNLLQHRRSHTCRDCNHSEYEYEDHAMEFEMTEYDDLFHTGAYSCALCDYSYSESEAHTLVYGAWESVSEIQHARTIRCFCGYNKTEYADHRDEDSDGYCDDCGKSMAVRFSVTVPASLLIAVSKNGEISTATNARIVNHSAGAVRVTSLSVSGEDGWHLVDYAHNMAGEKVDSKKIGFKVNGAETDSIDADNTARFDLTGNSSWRIGVESELPLAYDAVVSATSQPITDEQVLTLCFVVGWAA